MADNVTTIGERLEEARSRKGISIREAAEATKVRGDYLLQMESNSFEINLPEVYVRGFLKIYSNFLRLDTKKIVEDYEAMRAGNRRQHRLGTQKREEHSSPASEASPQPTRVSFGRMDLGEGSEQGEPPLAPHGYAINERKLSEDLLPYLRPALLISAIAVGIILIGLLVSSIWGGSKPEINPELANSAKVSTQPSMRPLTLIANNAVTVWVIRKSDNTRVFEGTLTPGETRNVDVDGPVEVRYSNGDSLQVERDGQRLRMSTSAGGRSIIQ
ncbi:MAG: DUF4115 domain-containing protein [Opitutales bacterium]|nr:DUF4115 domain-containing protein [Opitutales bacterium]